MAELDQRKLWASSGCWLVGAAAGRWRVLEKLTLRVQLQLGKMRAQTKVENGPMPGYPCGCDLRYTSVAQRTTSNRSCGLDQRFHGPRSGRLRDRECSFVYCLFEERYENSTARPDGERFQACPFSDEGSIFSSRAGPLLHSDLPRPSWTVSGL
jgi:hypothetical protein